MPFLKPWTINAFEEKGFRIMTTTLLRLSSIISFNAINYIA
jgi:uncharacterized membrane protein YdjX (TVP38/TMEM64 family)